MDDNMFGWELLYNNLKKDIKKKEDILMLLIHYCLIKSGFKCVGMGINDDWFNENEESAELLPENWSIDKEFNLRYLYNKNKYSICSSHTNDCVVIFNLMQMEPLKVTNAVFNFNSLVTTLEGTLAIMIPTYEQVLKNIQQDLLSSFLIPEKNHIHTQTDHVSNDSKKKSLPFIIPSSSGSSKNFNREVNIPNFGHVGREDLDPLAAMGSGGMLLNPFSRFRHDLSTGPGIPQRLPRGAVPPNARFDPFGPPDSNRNPNRNLFSPDYGDMFS